ncbi:MAG: hypothetical protein V3V96_15625 [Acidiferrobacterales bacterium]
MTEEIMRALGRLEQAAQDQRDDLQEIKVGMRGQRALIDKNTKSVNMLKGAGVVITTIFAGSAAWFGLGDG